MHLERHTTDEDPAIPHGEVVEPIRHVGRYAMFGPIAGGGMATLHLARLLASAGFASTVVLKRMRRELADDPEFVAMFVDEARTATRVRHANVVSTLDVVQDGGELFMVMEYVHGESLVELIRASCRERRWIPLPIISAVMSQAFVGLHAAHEAVSEQGEPLLLVHRDFSPHNVLVGSDGCARLADFGVAKASQNIHCTREGRSKGKFAYMSPEQVRGDGLDRRSDLFAAGVTLWEALTLRRLFYSDNVSKTATDILLRDVEMASVHNHGCPETLDAIVAQALAKEPSERFSSALAMVHALRAAVAPATDTEVSAWLRSLAGDALNQRAAFVKRIERATATAPASRTRPVREHPAIERRDHSVLPATRRDGTRVPS